MKSNYAKNDVHKIFSTQHKPKQIQLFCQDHVTKTLCKVHFSLFCSREKTTLKN